MPHSFESAVGLAQSRRWAWRREPAVGLAQGAGGGPGAGSHGVIWVLFTL